MRTTATLSASVNRFSKSALICIVFGFDKWREKEKREEKQVAFIDMWIRFLLEKNETDEIELKAIYLVIENKASTYYRLRYISKNLDKYA